MPEFKSSVELHCPPEQAFDFLIRPENLLRISPPGMGLVFVDAPEVLELGTRLEFKVQGFGQVQRMIHEIHEFVHPRRFAERMVKGPLKHWVQEHIFEPTADGRVLLIDRIEFEPPGGLIGFLITKQRILDHLEEGFDHRHAQLQRILGPQ